MSERPLNPRRTVDLIGAPLDLGGARRGTDSGPSALRIAGLGERVQELGYAVHDTGDVDVGSRERSEVGPASARYLACIARSCEELREEVSRSLAAGHLPLSLGGDHSIAIGTVAAVSGHFRAQGQPIGLIWVDAHADMNTPATSPSGNVHGMPLGVLLGLGAEELVQLGGFAPKVHPECVALIGIRDLDAHERDLVNQSGVHVFTMKDVDLLGMARVAAQALEVVTQDTAGFHLSFDLDGVDPGVAPGVGTPVPGGLTFRETHLLLELVAESRKLLSFDLVELNPILDARNSTAELGVSFVQSALGRQIL